MRKSLACVLVWAEAAAGGGARAGVLTAWDASTVTALQALGLSSPLQSRLLAIVRSAMFAALAAATCFTSGITRLWSDQIRAFMAANGLPALR